MTKYTFRVNGADFSAYVHKDGYLTDPVPEVAWEAKTLGGPKRKLIERWRHTLKLIMNPMPADAAVRLCTELMKTPLSITFTSLQTGAEVTAEMEISSMPQQHLLTARGTDWRRGTELYFEEL